MLKRAKNASSLDEVVVHLLHRASQRADDMFVEEVGEADLTPRQFAVLLSVAESEKPSQTDLVEITGIDRSTLADLVARLIKKDLLKRSRSRQDARAYIVQLTESGRQALASAKKNARRADTSLLARLPGEDRRSFVEALRVLSAE